MWEEQWARVQRSYETFELIENGRTHDRNSDFYRDDVLHFFQDCYHLKDWLKNDPASSGVVADLEATISASAALSLCADLANGAKHLALKQARTGDTTTGFGKKMFKVGLGTGQATSVAASFAVNSNGSIWDAFDIARQAMTEWESYLRAKGLLT